MVNVGTMVTLAYNSNDPMYHLGRVQSITKTKIGNRAGLQATIKWEPSDEEPNGFIEWEWVDNLKEVN
jgi:hypothetical protein